MKERLQKGTQLNRLEIMRGQKTYLWSISLPRGRTHAHTHTHRERMFVTDNNDHILVSWRESDMKGVQTGNVPWDPPSAEWRITKKLFVLQHKAQADKEGTHKRQADDSAALVIFSPLRVSTVWKIMWAALMRLQLNKILSNCRTEHSIGIRYWSST